MNTVFQTSPIIIRACLQGGRVTLVSRLTLAGGQKIAQVYIAHVASVSMGFGSKERLRNGIFGVLSLLPNPTETLATQAKVYRQNFTGRVTLQPGTT